MKRKPSTQLWPPIARIQVQRLRRVTESIQDAYDKFREVRYFGCLDGLRAVSILGVVWFHNATLAFYVEVAVASIKL